MASNFEEDLAQALRLEMNLAGQQHVEAEEAEEEQLSSDFK